MKPRTTIPPFASALLLAIASGCGGNEGASADSSDAGCVEEIGADGDCHGCVEDVCGDPPDCPTYEEMLAQFPESPDAGAFPEDERVCAARCTDGTRYIHVDGTDWPGSTNYFDEAGNWVGGEDCQDFDPYCWDEESGGGDSCIIFGEALDCTEQCVDLAIRLCEELPPCTD
jgi:hypothetical protein